MVSSTVATKSGEHLRRRNGPPTRPGPGCTGDLQKASGPNRLVWSARSPVFVSPQRAEWERSRLGLRLCRARDRRLFPTAKAPLTQDFAKSQFGQNGQGKAGHLAPFGRQRKRGHSTFLLVFRRYVGRGIVGCCERAIPIGLVPSPPRPGGKLVLSLPKQEVAPPPSASSLHVQVAEVVRNRLSGCLTTSATPKLSVEGALDAVERELGSVCSAYQCHGKTVAETSGELLALLGLSGPYGATRRPPAIPS